MDNNIKSIEELEARKAARQAAKTLKKKRKKKVKRIITWSLVAIILISLISLVLYQVYSDMNGVNGDDKLYVIDVPAGAGASTVSNLLANRGIIKYAPLFRLYAGNRYMFQQGRHSVSSSMTYKELLDTFASYADGGVGDQVEVVIPEGSELHQIAAILEEKGLVTEYDFMNEVNYGQFNYGFVNAIPRTENRLEGYIYPATYQIFPGTSPHDIVTMLLDAFNSKVMPVYNASNTTDPIDYVVTMASVIEREAASEEEMPIVSSVFNNRLYEGRKLESCATVQYILGERKPVLSEEDTEIDSPYNTYRNKGLPVGPICSPGLAAIRAALYPEQTPYMYFVAAADGSRNYFSETYAQHQEKVRQIQNGEPVTETTPAPAESDED